MDLGDIVQSITKSETYRTLYSIFRSAEMIEQHPDLMVFGAEYHHHCIIASKQQGPRRMGQAGTAEYVNHTEPRFGDWQSRDGVLYEDLE
jgi:hypothetical protein